MEKTQIAQFAQWAEQNGFSTRLRTDADSPDTFFAYETEQRWLVWQAAQLATPAPTATRDKPKN